MRRRGQTDSTSVDDVASFETWVLECIQEFHDEVVGACTRQNSTLDPLGDVHAEALLNSDFTAKEALSFCGLAAPSAPFPGAAFAPNGLEDKASDRYCVLGADRRAWRVEGTSPLLSLARPETGRNCLSSPPHQNEVHIRDHAGRRYGSRSCCGSVAKPGPRRSSFVSIVSRSVYTDKSPAPHVDASLQKMLCTLKSLMEDPTAVQRAPAVRVYPAGRPQENPNQAPPSGQAASRSESPLSGAINLLGSVLREPRIKSTTTQGLPPPANWPDSLMTHGFPTMPNAPSNNDRTLGEPTASQERSGGLHQGPAQATKAKRPRAEDPAEKSDPVHSTREISEVTRRHVAETFQEVRSARNAKAGIRQRIVDTQGRVQKLEKMINELQNAVDLM